MVCCYDRRGDDCSCLLEGGGEVGRRKGKRGARWRGGVQRGRERRRERERERERERGRIAHDKAEVNWVK